MSEPRRYIPTPTGFLIVLRRGDDVFAELATLMREQSVPSATIFGFGFAGEVTFGFYDFDRKEYRPKVFHELEVTNLTGTLAWKEGQPAIHAHGTAGDASFRTVGGHLLALTVGRGSMEISVTVIPIALQRDVDPEIGANILQL
ncbi:MAG: DNA-binding protein [Acetobacteraceae bacterium]|nr:DNA-binding protein [Acetobacteraceae bacterium]